MDKNMEVAEEQVHISVRNLVEFILRSGDIDNRVAGTDKDAMLLGGKMHRKIQRRMGADYHAEVPLKIEIPCNGFTLVIDGRADGIIENASDIVIDETKELCGIWSRLRNRFLFIWRRQSVMHTFMPHRRIWMRSECR